MTNKDVNMFGDNLRKETESLDKKGVESEISIPLVDVLPTSVTDVDITDSPILKELNYDFMNPKCFADQQTKDEKDRIHDDMIKKHLERSQADAATLDQSITYYTLEDVAKRFNLTLQELWHFAADEKLEICVLVPRGVVWKARNFTLMSEPDHEQCKFSTLFWDPDAVVLSQEDCRRVEIYGECTANGFKKGYKCLSGKKWLLEIPFEGMRINCSLFAVHDLQDFGIKVSLNNGVIMGASLSAFENKIQKSLNVPASEKIEAVKIWTGSPIDYLIDAFNGKRLTNTPVPARSFMLAA